MCIFFSVVVRSLIPNSMSMASKTLWSVEVETALAQLVVVSDNEPAHGSSHYPRWAPETSWLTNEVHQVHPQFAVASVHVTACGMSRIKSSSQIPHSVTPSMPSSTPSAATSHPSPVLLPFRGISKKNFEETPALYKPQYKVRTSMRYSRACSTL